MTGSHGGKGESRVGVEVSTTFMEEGAPSLTRPLCTRVSGPRGAHHVTVLLLGQPFQEHVLNAADLQRERESEPRGESPSTPGCHRPFRSNFSLIQSFKNLQLLIPSFSFFFFGFWCRHGENQYATEPAMGDGSRASQDDAMGPGEHTCLDVVHYAPEAGV